MGWLFASLRPYERTWLRGDLIAGLTVWAVLVPEALAYASIAGVSSALLAGVLRLGCLASFISEPVLKGFIVGLALTIRWGWTRHHGLKLCADGSCEPDRTRA